MTPLKSILLKNTLVKKVGLLALSFLLCGILVNVQIFRWEQKKLDEDFLKRMQHTAVLLQQQLRYVAREAHHVSTHILNRDNNKKWYAKVSNASDRYLQRQRILYDFAKQIPEVRSLSIFDAAGKIIATTDPDRFTDDLQLQSSIISHYNSVDPSDSSGAIVVGDFSSDDSFSVLRPIYNDSDKTLSLSYMAAFELSPTVINTILSSANTGASKDKWVNVYLSAAATDRGRVKLAESVVGLVDDAALFRSDFVGNSHAKLMLNNKKNSKAKTTEYYLSNTQIPGVVTPEGSQIALSYLLPWKTAHFAIYKQVLLTSGLTLVLFLIAMLFIVIGRKDELTPHISTVELADMVIAPKASIETKTKDGKDKMETIPIKGA